MNIPSVKTVGNLMKKNSPMLLTLVSIFGLTVTTISAVNDTPKALSLIEEEQWRLEREWRDSHKIEESTVEFTLTKWEMVKTAWTAYIPTALLLTATVASIIGTNSINAKRNAALSSAYFLSETALKEYRTKVIKTIGAQKAKVMHDEMAQDKVNKTKKSDQTVIVTGNGTTLCLDLISGRYFKTSVEKLKRAENEINKALMTDMWMSLNEMYGYIGIDPIEMGNELGWDINREGLLELDISACLSEDDEPCITFRFDANPKPKYS